MPAFGIGMRLDLWTLVFVTVFVTTLLGGLLLFSWSQNRRMGALSWWGAGFLMGAVGMSLLVLRGRAPDVISIVVANTVVFGSYGLLWTGCRVFAGKAAHWLPVAAAPLLWLGLCALPTFYESFPARVFATSLIMAAILVACAHEMSLTRPERLASRMPICLVLVAHAAVVASRPVVLLKFGAAHEGTLFTFPWVTGHALGTLVVTVLLSFLFLAITKERVELEQRTMASRDPLTGILNRRAFVAEAEGRLRNVQGGSEAVLLLLDIDHFKRVNDRYGHAAGDAMLQWVCKLAAERLPPGALFARLGGEEFGCLLTDTGLVDGFYAAEYLRNVLALRPLDIDGERIHVTVSVGLVSTAECGRDLRTMMSRADACLYEAKRAGRNRVLCSADRSSAGLAA
jgi:diguanylate cyclase (GGDEF)-like protein